jgi:hypothetical protein
VIYIEGETGSILRTATIEGCEFDTINKESGNGGGI